MADGLSVQLEKSLLDAAFGATAYTAPVTVYVAALTTAPTDKTGTGLAEVASGNSYTRVAVTNNATNWSAATGTTSASKTNGATIAFPQATGSWGTVVAVGVSSVSTIGDNTAANWLGFATLTVSQTIASGDTLEATAGNLTFTVS